MPYFPHDGLTFHYKDTGEGEPLVLLHGLGGDAEQPLELLQPLPGWRLISLDARCHGQTNPSPPADSLQFGTMATDVLALLEHVGLTSAWLAGISMGAATALRTACDYPDRVKGLILIRPAFWLQPFPEHLHIFAYVGQLIWAYGVKDGRAMLEEFQGFRQIQAEYPATAQSLLAQFDQERAVDFVERLRRMPAQTVLQKPDTVGALIERKLPCLLLANHQDPIHPWAYAEQLQDILSHAKLVEIPSKNIDPQGHAVRSREAVLDFLSNL